MTARLLNILLALVMGSFLSNSGAENISIQATTAHPSQPAPLSAELDHQRIMDLLHIKSLRRGADGDPKSPNAANYDESKADPNPKVPDPLLLKSGKKVTNAEMWWQERRPEIVEDFDREIYGRVPENTPTVHWEVPAELLID